MKKFALLYFVVGISFLGLQAQNTRCVVAHDGFDQLQVAFTAGELTAQSVTLDGQPFCLLGMEGTMSSQKEGDANLPTYSTLIEVPLCQGFAVEVSQMRFDTIAVASLGAGSTVMPRQPSYSKSDTAKHAMVWNKSTYAANAYMGAELALVERVGVARDRNLARLQISPIRYNAVEGKLIVCREAVVTISYQGADSAATMQMFERYNSPAFKVGNALNSLYPKSVSNAAPVRYLIVAHSMFHNQLENFVAWKQRKGFICDVVYTDNPSVGTTTSSISSYIHSQYTNATAANPAPTYVLIVGDHEQIPAYTGTTSSSHITDLYFMTWTSGDNIPDCYYGRFSAQNVSQLTTQIEKTLMYEQYTFADPSFLDRAVMVAGVDGGSSGDYGYTHADPAMDYAITHYVNGANGFTSVYYFKNNTSIVPTGSNVTIGSNASSNSATVRSYYNQGAGWINYSAHGSATSWGTPNFTTSHAEAMTNTQKFGLMIGNCCLTNKFETTTCLGEAVLRKGNYCGAVGYIGGTNSTYWYEDFYWAVGLRSSIGATMSMAFDASHPGNYDDMCHTHGESHSQWVETQGGLVLNGNVIVESSTSSRKLYYWEIYQLMGDPSLMPYRTQADSIQIVAASHLPCGTTSLSVQAVPYAYVALTNPLTHSLIDAAWCDATGAATLTLPANMQVGAYEIAASAQQYRTTFKTLNMIAPNGPFAVANLQQSTIAAGTSVWIGGKLTNMGNQTASNITVHFSCDNSDITMLTDSIVVASLAAGDTLHLDSLVHIAAAQLMPDMTSFAISANTSWSGAAYQSETQNSMVCQAAQIDINFANLPVYVMPGGHYTLNITAHNQGHQAMLAASMELQCPIGMAYITPTNTSPVTLASGASATRQYSLDIDSAMPLNIALPLEVILGATVNAENTTASTRVGEPVKETFEGSAFHLAGWTQGTYPWTIVSGESVAGTCSARSNASLTHSQTSEMTLTRNTSGGDSISFYYKVSSESNYDKLHFYIDGTEQLTASGTVAWTRAAFPITAGDHTFSFAYQKDVSVSSGSDCVWIDEIQLPQVSHPWRTIADTVCYGQQVTVMGSPLNTLVPGDIYAADTTGDTVVFWRYTVMPQNSVDTIVTACDQFIWNGNAYTETGIFTDSLPGAGGCPVYYRFNLTVKQGSSSSLTAEACDEYTIWGETFTETGSYTNTLTNAVGCDSVVTLALTIHPSTHDTVNAFTIDGPYLWHGNNYQHSGYYPEVHESVYGCDSIIVLALTIQNDSVGIENCEAFAIKCYPNPTSGALLFCEKVKEAKVYDITGRLTMVLRETASADLQALPNGIYTIEATLPDGRTARVRVAVAR